MTRRQNQWDLVSDWLRKGLSEMEDSGKTLPSELGGWVPH